MLPEKDQIKCQICLASSVRACSYLGNLSLNRKSSNSCFTTSAAVNETLWRNLRVLNKEASIILQNKALKKVKRDAIYPSKLT